ncbi:hypothetical protein [Rhizobium sp. SG741]|nr:hypothetical protein [Rhizobium sp. SG741]NKJ07957.1 2,4-dienoyl-CoA reductase-like NADH-dependent reductase (Old Yellow Enzyme family) [Rhizobium sp. SG741]
MRTIEKAEHILVDGRADFIAIGRPILERPPADWRKSRERAV